MKIKTQFTITMVVFGLVLLIMAASVLITNQQVERLSKKEEIAHNIQQGAGEISYLLTDYLLYRESQQRTRWETEWSSLSKDLAQLQPGSPEQQVVVDNIKANHRRLKAVFDSVASVFLDKTRAPSTESVQSAIQVSWSRMAVQSQGMVFDALRLSQMLSDQADELKRTNLILISVLLATFGAYFLINYLIAYRHALRSISTLQAGTRVVGSGNLDFEIEIERDDEIGDLSRAFNQMTADLKETTTSKRVLELEVEQRKQAEKALGQSEARYRLVFEGIQESFIVQEIIRDDEGEIVDLRYLEVNPVAENVLGKTHTELIGHKRSEVQGPLDPEAAAIVSRAARGESVKQERYIPAMARWFEVFSYSPQPGQIATLNLDITERKKAEAEVAHLASFPELNPNPVIELDKAGNIRYLNPAAKTSFPDLSAKGSRHPFLANWESLVKQLGHEEEYSLSREINVGDSWYEQTVSRVPLSEDCRLYALNITERKRAEESLEKTMAELRRSNDELQQFAHVASHDLQEPLRMIASYLQLIKKRYEGKLDADADDFIKFAVDGASRLQNMIEGLLSYSRVVTKGEPFEPMEPAEALRIAITNVRLTIDETGAVVTHGSLPAVMADGAQLVQLFQNLIINAVNFRGERAPRIHVSAEEKGDDCVFSVRDNGIGFPPEYKERIFVLFERLHGFEYPGTGMGLAICKRIVERHGGRIWVESKPGQGSTFYFSLPLTKAVTGDGDGDG